jgi:hypothetical protein
MGALWREKEQSVMTCISLSAFGHILYKTGINASQFDTSRLQEIGYTG